MRSLICLLIALPLAAPAQAPEPSLRTTVTEVLLDLVVRDKKARIVRDLRPDEVQVFEDSVPQRLRHFEFFEGRPAPQAQPRPALAPATVPAPQADAPAPARDVQELRDISVVSVVVGNMDQRGRKLTMDAMRDFVSNELRPDTYVGVFWLGPGGVRAVQPYTNDAERISAAVKRAVTGVGFESGKGLRPHMLFGGMGEPLAGWYDNEIGPDTVHGATAQPLTGVAAEIARLMETSWVTEMHDVYQASAHYLWEIRKLVQSQAGIPGRKVVLLFSAGLLVHPDTVEVLRGAISAANRSNVSIYAVDTRGYTSQPDLANARRELAAAARASMTQQLSTVTGGDQLSITHNF